MLRIGVGVGLCDGGGAFLPPRIAGLFGWYESGIVTLNGSTVSQWDDQSGAGNHASNATGPQQPTYSASDATFAGRPSLAFAGGQALMTAIAAKTQPITMYAFGFAGAAGTQVFVNSASGTECATYANAGNASCYAGTALGSATAVTAPRAICAVLNGGSSAVYVTSSGTAVATGAGGANGLDSVRIGSSAAMGSPLIGKLVLVLLYAGAHTALQRAAVFGYGGPKHGIAVAA